MEGIQIHRLKYLQMDRSGFLGRLVNYFSFTFMVLLHLPEIAGYRAAVVYSNPPILPWIASWAKALFGTKLIFVSYDLYPEVATVDGYPAAGQHDLPSDEPHQPLCLPPGGPGGFPVFGAAGLHSPSPGHFPGTGDGDSKLVSRGERSILQAGGEPVCGQ